MVTRVHQHHFTALRSVRRNWDYIEIGTMTRIISDCFVLFCFNIITVFFFFSFVFSLLFVVVVCLLLLFCFGCFRILSPNNHTGSLQDEARREKAKMGAVQNET